RPSDQELGALQEQLVAVGNSQQLWVHCIVLDPRRVVGRFPVRVSIDTGAGGGNYISLAFLEERSGVGRERRRQEAQ
ncbi:MAG: hypothetical protein ABJ056_04045, partial [Halioglobus sp.]